MTLPVLALWMALFLHVLMTALWMGGGIYMIHIVRPSLATLPPDRRKEALDRILSSGDPFHLATGWLAVVTGALGGIGLRRYEEALSLETRWGWAIAVSVALAVAMLVPGTRKMLRVVRGRMAGKTAPELTGRPPLDPPQWTRFRRINREGWLRTIGFVVALALMSLARIS